MTEHHIDTRLRELLDGKRVALIGPSRTLMDKRYGPAINEYDIICRVNELYPWDWEGDYGNRTDIMFHSFGLHTIPVLDRALLRNAFVTQSLQFMVLPQRSHGLEPDDNRLQAAASINRDPRKYGRNRQIPFHHVGDEWWQAKNKEIGSSPNTGYLALLALLEYPLAELMVAGYTWYSEGVQHGICHYPPYMGWGGDEHKPQAIEKPHNQTAQLRHLREVVLPAHRERLVLEAESAQCAGLTEEDAILRTLTPGPTYLPDRQVAGMLNGFRVALVGPAPYLSGSNMGPELDGFDVVCRVNQLGAFNEEDDYGSRTDIVFHADGKPCIEALELARRKHRKAAGQVKHWICLGPSQPAYHELGRRVGWSPNTGMAALSWILTYYCPAELFVTGFSFYQQGQASEARHCQSYIGQQEPTALLDESRFAQSGRVNQEPQRKWFRDMARTYRDVLRCDGRLLAILGTRQAPAIGNVHGLRYAAYRAYYGEDWIAKSIASVRGEVDKVLVYWSDRAFADVTGCEWKGEWMEFPRPIDRLPEIVAGLAAKDSGIELFYDHWGMPQAQWSHLINDRILAEHERPEWLMCFDTDMVWCRDDLRRFIVEAGTAPVPLAASEITHWRTPEYMVTRKNPRPGPIIWYLNKDCRWLENGLLMDTDTNAWPDKGKPVRLAEASCHNFGFCLSKRTMLFKHLTAMAFSRAINDSAPNPDWYEEKWLNWDYERNNENLEISRGYEDHIARADKYDGPLPEVL